MEDLDTERRLRSSRATTLAVEERGRRMLEIRRQQSAGIRTVAAAGYLGRTGYRTYASPYRFVGDDGIRYRVKMRAQQGLGVELVIGRLGAYFGIAPETTVLEIGPGAVPDDHSVDYLIGRQVASVEIDDVMNDDELRSYGVELKPEQIDWLSWAQVVCFQTWIYAQDPQAMIRLSDGKVFSIDHGNCLSALPKGPLTGLVVPRLHGATNTSFPSTHVAKAVQEIERMTEASILAIVAGVPDDPGWRMPIERQLKTAEWLLSRQPDLREVMGPWMPQVS
jgi:hypothetical protein